MGLVVIVLDDELLTFGFRFSIFKSLGRWSIQAGCRISPLLFFFYKLLLYEMISFYVEIYTLTIKILS